MAAEVSQRENTDTGVDESAESVVTSRWKTELWHPLWLRKSVLSVFMFLFLLMSAGLVVLWYFVNRYKGIPLTESTSHYIWTYGPTAILVVVVSLWRQVDYCCKMNQPWQELQEGPQSAARTVLLDYMWPLQINSFIAALKNRHFAVATSIFVFFMLKLIIVISTTLFTPTPSTMAQDIQITRSTRFDSSLFWNTTPPEVTRISDGTANGTVLTGYPLGAQGGGVTYDNVSSDSTWTYMHLKQQYADSEAPIELAMAFTNFSVNMNVPDQVYRVSAEVAVFHVNVTCEIATLGWTDGEPGQYINMTLRTPSCNIGTTRLALCSIDPSGKRPECPTIGRNFEVKRVDCTKEQPYSNFYEVYVDVNTTNSYQYAIVTSKLDLRRRSTSNTTGTIYTPFVESAAAISCQFDYALWTGMAESPELDARHFDHVKLQDGSSPAQIPNFSSLQLSEAVFSGLDQSSPIFFNDGETIGAGSMGDQGLYGVMTTATKPGSTLDDFFDAFTLQSTVQDTLTGLSQQLIRRFFLVPDNSTATGTVEYRERRLHVRPAVIWTMISLFAGLSGMVVVVIICTKQYVAPLSPSCLVSSAVCLSRSPSLMKVLEGEGAKRLSQIRNDLAHFNFTTVTNVINGRLSIETMREDTQGQAAPRPPTRLSRTWSSMRQRFTWVSRAWSSIRPKRKKATTQKLKREWTPYSARRHAVILTLLLPFLAITVLETLWYFSEHSENFINVSEDSSVSAYAIRYGSTATVLIIATLFNTLDFAIATMTRFSMLRSGRASARSTILFSVVGNLPPVALYKTIRNRHIGATLSLSAALIGSTLTIIVSGLWIFDPKISIEREATGKILDRWNITWTRTNESDNGVAALFNNIQHGGVDESRLIWGSLVLPAIGEVTLKEGDFRNFGSVVNSSSLQYDLTVLALRPILECEVLPSSAINVKRSLSQISAQFGSNNFTVKATLPASCISTTQEPNASHTATFSSTLDFNQYDSINWIGILTDLDVTSSGTSNINNGCPSLGAIYGKYNQDYEDDHNLTALLCYQRLHEAGINVTYSGGPQILTANFSGTPQVAEGTERNLNDSRTGTKSSAYRVSTYFNAGATAFASRQNERFDRFFSHLLWTPPGIQHESLLGPSNANSLMSAMNKLYQAYMTHVIDLNFRVNSDSSHSNVERGSLATHQALQIRTVASLEETVDGKVRGIASRLKVSKVSKIILEGMLGSMILLGGCAYLLVDMRGTLPRNPYPIASAMALFAGSKLCEMDIATKDEKEVATLLSTHTFSLGWWRAKEDADSDEGQAQGHEEARGQRPEERQEREAGEIREELEVAVQEHASRGPTRQASGVLVADDNEQASAEPGHDEASVHVHVHESSEALQIDDEEGGGIDPSLLEILNFEDDEVFELERLPSIGHNGTYEPRNEEISDATNIQVGDASESLNHDTTAPELIADRRFGIDIPVPGTLGFSEKGQWRRRLLFLKRRST